PTNGQVEMPIVPPMVYVPVGDVPTGDDVQIIFRRTLDGRLALVLYTALDRLVDCGGPHQYEIKKGEPVDKIVVSSLAGVGAGVAVVVVGTAFAAPVVLVAVAAAGTGYLATEFVKYLWETEEGKA